MYKIRIEDFLLKSDMYILNLEMNFTIPLYNLAFQAYKNKE